MNEKNLTSMPSSVFCFSKFVDNGKKLACDVVRMPLHEFNRTSYTFSLRLIDGLCEERETVEDVTVDIGEAEHIFNLLCAGSVHPCHLFDVISDLIA